MHKPERVETLPNQFKAGLVFAATCEMAVFIPIHTNFGEIILNIHYVNRDYNNCAKLSIYGLF